MPLRNDPVLEKLEPLRRLSGRPRLGYGVAVISVALAVSARLALGQALSGGGFLTFYPAVVATSIVGRLRPGLLAIGLSVVAADYFLVPPIYSFALTSGQALALLFLAFNLGLIVVVISLLYEALDRISRQQSNLRFVFDTEPVGLIAIDAGGTITLANKAAERQFGYAQSELIGKSIDLLVPERFRAGHPAHRQAFMRRPEERAMGAGRDLFGLRRDGREIPVEVGLSPIVREDQRGALATVVDISERKSAEDRQQILIHEVQHRARNLLSIVQVIAMRTFTVKTTMAEARQSFMGSVGALGRAMDLFATKGSALLSDVVEPELAPFKDQVGFAGDDVSLTSKAAQDFALILHELCTNAMKHGALSRPEGRVSVKWRRDGDSLNFAWLESDGPPVNAPQHKGFGETILKTLANGFCTEVDVDYAPSGFRYRLTAPLAQVSPQAPPDDVLRRIA